jgi:hypothetical protein
VAVFSLPITSPISLFLGPHPPSNHSERVQTGRIVHTVVYVLVKSPQMDFGAVGESDGVRMGIHLHQGAVVAF